jgi:hypothetical protein
MDDAFARVEVTNSSSNILLEKMIIVYSALYDSHKAEDQKPLESYPAK